MIISPINHQFGPYSYSSPHHSKEDIGHPDNTIIDNNVGVSHRAQASAEPKLLPLPTSGRGTILDIFV